MLPGDFDIKNFKPNRKRVVLGLVALASTLGVLIVLGFVVTFIPKVLIFIAMILRYVLKHYLLAKVKSYIITFAVLNSSLYWTEKLNMS